MAFERADGRRGVGLENVAYTGLPSNRGHNLYVDNVGNKQVSWSLYYGLSKFTDVSSVR
jgi:hypothetical protein